jgi:hypothetical protein
MIELEQDGVHFTLTREGSEIKIKADQELTPLLIISALRRFTEDAEISYTNFLFERGIEEPTEELEEVECHVN